MRTQADRDEDLAIGRELERKDAEVERLRAALGNIHEHAIMGHDDAADGFIKIAGMVRDALNIHKRGET